MNFMDKKRSYFGLNIIKHANTKICAFQVCHGGNKSFEVVFFAFFSRWDACGELFSCSCKRLGRLLWYLLQDLCWGFIRWFGSHYRLRRQLCCSLRQYSAWESMHTFLVLEHEIIATAITNMLEQVLIPHIITRIIW